MHATRLRILAWLRRRWRQLMVTAVLVATDVIAVLPARRAARVRLVLLTRDA